MQVVDALRQVVDPTQIVPNRSSRHRDRVEPTAVLEVLDETTVRKLAPHIAHGDGDIGRGAGHRYSTRSIADGGLERSNQPELLAVVPSVETNCDEVVGRHAQGGELAGQAMIEALGAAGGKVVIIDYRAVESCQERVRGFKKVIDAHNKTAAKKIKIVAELPGEGDRAKGFKAAEDALQTEPDTLRKVHQLNGDPDAA